MRNKLRFATLALILGLALIAGADDGMWMPHQMKDLNLKALGLQMNPDDLYQEGRHGTDERRRQPRRRNGRVRQPRRTRS